VNADNYFEHFIDLAIKNAVLVVLDEILSKGNM
jgi:hypothetical protein